MELSVLFNNYCEEVKLNKSKGTYDYNRSKCNRLLVLFEEMYVFETNQISISVFNDLIMKLRKEVSHSTINKLVLVLKQAYKFSDLDFEYLLKFKKLRETKKRFDVIEHDELKIIINYLNDLNPNENNNLLYQAMLFIMLETGVRSHELINIEIGNIDLKNRMILLTTTKTKKDRYVFYTSLSEYYINMMIQKGPKDRKKLLYNFMKKRSAEYKDLKYLIDKLKFELNIRKLHAHMFRHTFATMAYENGMDVFVLKELLGHENIETTMIYTHISNSKLQQSYLNTFNKVNR